MPANLPRVVHTVGGLDIAMQHHTPVPRFGIRSNGPIFVVDTESMMTV